MYAQDVLQRCQIPFVVLGDIAYQMKHDLPLRADKVVFAVLQRNAVQDTVSLLPTVEPKIEVLTDGWRIVYHDIPVYIKVMPKDYEVLMDPDTVFYWVTEFRVPNPFEKYWNSNHLDV
jgi:hypothetical protein